MPDFHISRQYAESIINIVYNSTYGEPSKHESSLKDRIDFLRCHPSLNFYIPPNCAENIYSRESNIDLTEEVIKFMHGDTPILLLLGDSGSGKSTFCTHLAISLIDEYQKDNNSPLPVLIRLGTAVNAVSRGMVIEDEFERFGLSRKDIAYLRKYNEFVFILDGYDELRSKQNIYIANRLNEWNAKVIISCRTQYLENSEEYCSLFSKVDPLSHQADLASYKVLFIVPFSNDKVEGYLQKYAISKDSKWKHWESYKEKINSIYNLKELSSNPFLLNIISQTLPAIQVEKIKGSFTKEDLYQEFFNQWFDREQSRLGINFEKELFYEFAQEIAFEMLLTEKMQIKYASNKSLFRPTSNRLDRLLEIFNSPELDFMRARSGCPLQRSGNNLYHFMHKSFQEFCVARKLGGELNENIYHNLNKKLLTGEYAIIHFLAEMNLNQEKLLAILEYSKTNHQMAIASANAATILNKKRFCFSCRDLSKVQIPHADLSGAVLDQSNLSEANLTGVNFNDASLNNADLCNSLMKNVNFGEMPFLETKGRWITSICFSPKGAILASSTNIKANPIQLWDVFAGKVIATLEGHSSSINSVCFNHDGSFLAGGSGSYDDKKENIEDNSIHLWELSTGKVISTLKGHKSYVKEVCFSPDGSLLASGSADQTIRLWEVATGRLISTLEGHDSSVKSVCFSPNGTLLASGSAGNYFDKQKSAIHLWELAAGKPILTLEDHGSSVCFSPDGTLLASGGFHKNICLWEVATGKPVLTLEGEGSSLCFNHDGTILASIDDKSINLWEVASGKLISILMSSYEFQNISFNHDSSILASGVREGVIRLWILFNNRLLPNFEGHSYTVNSVCFSPDGFLLASGSADKSIHLWEASTGKHISLLEGHKSYVNSVCFSSDGALLASGSADHTIRIWEVDTGKSVSTLEGHKSYVNSICFSPDGALLASGSADKTIRLWEAASGKLVSVLEGHKSYVNSVCFSPDGALLASGSADKTIRLWEAASGKLISVLEGHNFHVDAVLFNDDGTMLISRSGCYPTISRYDFSDLDLFKKLIDLCLIEKSWDHNYVFSHYITDEHRLIAFLDKLGIRNIEPVLEVWRKNYSVWMWDVSTSRHISTLKWHRQFVRTICLDFENSVLISGGSSDICLYDMMNGELFSVLGGHRDWIMNLCLNPDKTLLASGSADHSVRVWDIKTKTLKWTTHNWLNCRGTKIKGVHDLSETNRRLLMQHGAIFE